MEFDSKFDLKMKMSKRKKKGSCRGTSERGREGSTRAVGECWIKPIAK